MSCLWDLTLRCLPIPLILIHCPRLSNDKATNEDEDVDMEVEVDAPFLGCALISIHEDEG